jgi:phosphoglycolate phosphatase
MFGPAKAIIFDMDGTLLDSMPSALRGLKEAVEVGLGHAIGDEELHKTLGMAPADIIRTWIPSEPVAYDRALAYWNKFHAALTSQDYIPFFGIPELLTYLKGKDIPFALLTGRDRFGTLGFLNELGWMDTFFTEERIIAGDELHVRPKPSPEGVVHLAKVMGVEPKDVLMVGDGRADMLAGSAAGAMTAGVLWDFPPGPEPRRLKFKRLWERFDGLPCDMRLENPGALIAWLEGTTHINT